MLFHITEFQGSGLLGKRYETNTTWVLSLLLLVGRQPEQTRVCIVVPKLTVLGMCMLRNKRASVWQQKYMKFLYIAEI